jgi:hypothetical protein
MYGVTVHTFKPGLRRPGRPLAGYGIGSTAVVHTFRLLANDFDVTNPVGHVAAGCRVRIDNPLDVSYTLPFRMS